MTQPRLPNIHEYQHMGAYMRDLRLYYGLDVAQVAQRIHIRVKYIQAIEDGRFEELPGKVYTRGYIVTYAEFLGLDAELFASNYMGEAKPEAHYFVPEPKRIRMQGAAKRRGYWVLALLLAGAAVAVYWPQGANREGGVQDAVEDVPEQLLESLRNVLMPVASNYACLMQSSPLGCHAHLGRVDVGGLWGGPFVRPFHEAAKVELAAPAGDAAVVLDVPAIPVAAPVPAPVKDVRPEKPAATPVPAAVRGPSPFSVGASVEAQKPVAKPAASPAPVTPVAEKPVAPVEQGAPKAGDPAKNTEAVVPEQAPVTTSAPAPKEQEEAPSASWWEPVPHDPNAPQQDLFPRRRR